MDLSPEQMLDFIAEVPQGAIFRVQVIDPAQNVTGNRPSRLPLERAMASAGWSQHSSFEAALTAYCKLTSSTPPTGEDLARTFEAELPRLTTYRDRYDFPKSAPGKSGSLFWAFGFSLPGNLQVAFDYFRQDVCSPKPRSSTAAALRDDLTNCPANKSVRSLKMEMIQDAWASHLKEMGQ